MTRFLKSLARATRRKPVRSLRSADPRHNAPDHMRLSGSGEVMAGMIHLPNILPRAGNIYG